MPRPRKTIELNENDFTVSYSYAAVMGTGTYKIDGRRITMLRLPFSLTQRRMTEEQFGMKWYAPVVIGYDAVSDNDWLDTIFDEDLVTLSVMPGFQAHLPLGEHWSIKPFGNLGVTQDFSLDETIAMAVLGIKGQRVWRRDDGSEFRWGAAGRLVGEYQTRSDETVGFSLLETGLDYRLDTAFRMLEHKINVGAYYLLQYYLPVWDIAESPNQDSEIRTLHEVGFSFGFKEPRKLFGFYLDRVRVGYKYGNDFRGWTMGTTFPF